MPRMQTVEASYLLETFAVAEQRTHAYACCTRASACCTLTAPSAAAPSSRLQCLVPCDDDEYNHPNSVRKIPAKLALHSSRSSH